MDGPFHRNLLMSLFLSLVKEKSVLFFFFQLKMFVFLFLGKLFLIMFQYRRLENRKEENIYEEAKDRAPKQGAKKTKGPSLDLVLISLSLCLLLVPCPFVFFLLSSQTKFVIVIASLNVKNKS